MRNMVKIGNVEQDPNIWGNIYSELPDQLAREMTNTCVRVRERGREAAIVSNELGRCI